MRVLEWFAGIGGCAAALPSGATVVAAIDQNPYARAAYTANFAHPVHPWNIATVHPRKLPPADLWWMSPPCQPYTVRGARRDLDDRRAAPLVHVLELIDALRPPAIALENVATFAGSRSHALVRRTLADAGYDVAETEWCPTAFGVPSERPRFYLVARRDAVHLRPPEPHHAPLRSYLDAEPAPELWVEPALLDRFGGALHVVDADVEGSATAVFTSAYGKSPVYAGSYLRTPTGPRRFSPAEILRLLHFGPRYALPPLPLPRAWALVGNSLSVAVVRAVVRAALGAC